MHKYTRFYEWLSACRYIIYLIDCFLSYSAIESLTANLKSHLLALALHYGIVENSSQAVDLSLLELQSQQDRWGSLEDAHSLSKASLSRHVHLGELMLLCSGRN